MTRRIDSVLNRLQGGLVVSSQAPEGSPLRHPKVLAAMALAALDAGAKGIRLDGPAVIREVRKSTKAPIIGLLKRGTKGVYITPTFADARRLADAGADLIALDATLRRPDLAEFVTRIVHDLKVGVVADVADAAEGRRAALTEATLVASTLSGYVGGGPVPNGPDLALVTALARTGKPVLAEGRYATRDEVREAFRRGAWCVCIGGAITRPDSLTKGLLP
jgi:N-acylglucosamine-6-phosphate 2-epimerase